MEIKNTFSSFQVGNLCFMFRKQVLKLTLHELSDKSGVKVSTLSAFENGRSTNITHIGWYLAIANNKQKTIFTKHFNDIISGV